MSLISVPLIFIAPFGTSYNLIKRFASVVFPLPIVPIIPSLWPFFNVILISSKVFFSLVGYLNVRLLISISPSILFLYNFESSNATGSVSKLKKLSNLHIQKKQLNHQLSFFQIIQVLIRIELLLQYIIRNKYLQ